MFDLFADDSSSATEDEGTPVPEVKLELKQSHITDNLYGDQDAIDIRGDNTLKLLAKSNPNTLLPHILPIPKKEVGADGNFFNRVGTTFIHIQMPSMLPALKKDVSHGGETVYQPSRLECLPSGKIGRLKIHRSGAVKLHIDGHVFAFSQGNKSTCKQQVACMLDGNDEFLFLGSYHNRFVVYPDLTNVSQVRP